MADNVTANAGSGGAVFAADDISSVYYPRSKITIGIDGVTDGDVAATNPLPIGANTVKDGSGTVYAPLVDSDAHLQIDVLSCASHAVTNAGTFAVQVDGSALTALQLLDDVVYADDAAFTLGTSKGVMVMGFAGTQSVDANDAAALACETDGALHIHDGGNSITVDNGGTFAVQAAQSGTWNITNVSGTVSLPTGAATAAKQPALGTAGTASSDVITVQGIASMTPLLATITFASAQAVTQSGSWTVTANAGTNLNTSALALESGGNLAAAVTALQVIDNLVLAEDAAHQTGDPGVQALAVRQDSDAALGADGDYAPLQVDDNGYLKVNIKAGAGSGGTASTDDAAFTAASGSGTPMMGFVTADTVDSGDVGVVGMDANRNLKVSIEVDNVGIGGGTQYNIDDASAGTDTGTLALAIRDDALGALTPAEGDYNALRVDSTGALWVRPTSLLSIDEAVYVDDADWTDGASRHVLVGGVYQSSPQTITDGDVGPFQVDSNGNIKASLVAGTAAIGKLAANSGVDIGDVDILSIAAGDNNIGNVDIVTVPSDPFGANADAASASGSISAKLRFIASTGIPITGTVTVGSHAVTNAGTFAVQVTSLPASTNTIEVVGDVAQDAAVAGNPLLCGARASTATPTAMSADGDAVHLWATRNGALVVSGSVAHDGADAGNPHKVGAKATASVLGGTPVAAADRTDLYAGTDGVLITRPYTSLEDIISEQKTNTDGASTAMTGAFAATASQRIYLTSLCIANSSATDLTVDIRDGSAGSVLFTAPVPAGGGFVHAFPVPLRFSANTAAAFDGSAAATTLTVSMIGFKSKA